MNLQELVVAAAKDMKIQLEKIRIAASHAGLKGTAAEEVLASFLRERLPTSLGVTTGQVVDRNGALSKQVDVVIYDAARTPILFTSAEKSWNVVPAEGVLAVIEVKMHLKSGDIPSVLANCASTLNLQRDAYIGDPIPKFETMGDRYAELPISFHLFAFESDSMYSREINRAQSALALPEHITSVCYLDRGVNLHTQIAGTQGIYSDLPSEPGYMADISSGDSLLVWFTSLCTTLFQCELRPIALTSYAGEALQSLPGTMSQLEPDEQQELIAKFTDHLLGQRGIAPGIGAKMYVDKIPLNEGEIEALQAAGIHVRVDDSGFPHLTLP